MTYIRHQSRAFKTQFVENEALRDADAQTTMEGREHATTP
jgi:hypothetical protein